MSEAHRPSIFLSTPSARRATSPPGSVCQAYRYFYPRPPRGGRPHRWRRYSWQWRISIHALREEGDQLSGPVMLLPYQFLSTPSARRATGTLQQEATEKTNFYPRPPRGGRRSAFLVLADFGQDFYPRPPRGGRRHEPEYEYKVTDISIHALREEGDLTAPGISSAESRFLSTPSARRATRNTVSCWMPVTFLSTPSARRATGIAVLLFPARGISIHALREEGDAWMSGQSAIAGIFLSTPSARRATKPGASNDVHMDISIHALREEGDTGYPAFRPDAGGFLSTPSARRATRQPRRRTGDD